MELDLYKLKEGLKDYKQTLREHNALLEASRRDVEEAFFAFSLHYGGEKGQEFRNHWQITSDWLDDYIKTTNHLVSFLNDGINKLDKTNT